MTEQLTMIAVAGSALGGIAVLAGTTLKGWHGWLELKRLELSGRHGSETRGPMAERIEMADLKERIRKLESIAACVDL
jgi:trehalose-6-phosphatase